MTTVVVTRKSGHIVAYSVSGHTGFGEEGNDIVCASLSAVTQTALLGLKNVAKADVSFTRDRRKGYLKVTVNPTDADARLGADMILETMLCGIRDIADGYPQRIKLEVK